MLKFSEMLESRRDKRDREDIMDVLKKYLDRPVKNNLTGLE